MKNQMFTTLYYKIIQKAGCLVLLLLCTSPAGANEIDSNIGGMIAGNTATGAEIEKMVYIFLPLAIIALAMVIRTIKLLLSHEQHS